MNDERFAKCLQTFAANLCGFGWNSVFMLLAALFMPLVVSARIYTFLNIRGKLHLVKFVQELLGFHGFSFFVYLLLGRGGGRGSVSEVTHQRCHTLAPPPGNVYPDKYVPEHRISAH